MNLSALHEYDRQLCEKALETWEPGDLRQAIEYVERRSRELKPEEIDKALDVAEIMTVLETNLWAMEDGYP